MTIAEYNAAVKASIAARIAAEPILAPCVCGLSDDEPELNRVHYYAASHEVCCHACDRSVHGPTKDEAVRMWNAANMDRAFNLIEEQDRLIVSLRAQFADEAAIVDRIWRLFGNPSFESLKGLSIYDLITECQRERDALREQSSTPQAESRAWQKEAAMLIEACEDALEFITDYEDIYDGDYGCPQPNRAMRVASMLREAIKGATTP